MKNVIDVGWCSLTRSKVEEKLVIIVVLAAPPLERHSLATYPP